MIATKDKIGQQRIIKISPFRSDVRVTVPHKHQSYFELIFLTKAGGFHSIDSNRYRILAPVVFFVKREQVHFWELDGRPEGFVLIIKKRFVEMSLDREIQALLFRLSKTEMLQLRETEAISTLFELLAKECLAEITQPSAVIEGLLKALLAKLLLESNRPAQSSVAQVGSYHQFRELLSQQSRLKNSVSHYAALLHTSPQNLNAVCRREAMLSAAQVISEFIISEAKRLLIYTDNTISQIAFLLGFSDPSHFVKYFRRFTGRTPKIFRCGLNAP